MNYVISEIEDNEVLDLHVSEENEELIEDDTTEFIEALSANTAIQSIHFDGEFLGCLRGSDRSKVIQTIGKIPTLREVHMNQSLVMVRDISALLARATKLRVLKMNRIVFQGVESDHEACERILYEHPCLREFDIRECRAAAVKNVTLQKLERAGRRFQEEMDASSVYPRPTSPVAVVTSDGMSSFPTMGAWAV